ncbi:hypothetical protein PENSPDRAFT_329559 [Peniophora sp. CONT]|nr:hypothetical protein PENSPDRAFT_329559 [Peniophora sp. CONT]
MWTGVEKGGCSEIEAEARDCTSRPSRCGGQKSAVDPPRGDCRVSSLTKREKGLSGEPSISNSQTHTRAMRRSPRKRKAKRKRERMWESTRPRSERTKGGVRHAKSRTALVMYSPRSHSERYISVSAPGRMARLATTNGDGPHRGRGNISSPRWPRALVVLPRAPDVRTNYLYRQRRCDPAIEMSRLVRTIRVPCLIQPVDVSSEHAYHTTVTNASSRRSNQDNKATGPDAVIGHGTIPQMERSSLPPRWSRAFVARCHAETC